MSDNEIWLTGLGIIALAINNYERNNDHKACLPQGPKIGWFGGFLGASLWLIILSIVYLVNQDLWAGLLGLLFYLVCLTCIFFLRPWKYPQARLWKLYIGTMAPLLLAAAFFYWQEYPLDFSLSGMLNIFPILFVLFLPAWLHGKKTWNDFHTVIPGPPQPGPKGPGKKGESDE